MTVEFGAAWLGLRVLALGGDMSSTEWFSSFHYNLKRISGVTQITLESSVWSLQNENE